MVSPGPHTYKEKEPVGQEKEAAWSWESEVLGMWKEKRMLAQEDKRNSNLTKSTRGFFL